MSTERTPVRELLMVALIIREASEDDGYHWLGTALHERLKAAIDAVQADQTIKVASRSVVRPVQLEENDE